eukprot:TRINITY_DN4241_c0_g1_i1.p1 TRINITY_DN4241_c0_g1~~TRINITY_DN4241_c0_g1_i1.p1  ORF type:complete len:204 (-),score=43.18 TRINITY_DN4241_c0_g1_i1:293-904(-)
MQYNKQADKCSQIIIETLRMRIIESTKLFKKALQKRSEFIKNTEEKKSKFNGFTGGSLEVSNKAGRTGKALFLKKKVKDHDDDFEKGDKVTKRALGNDEVAALEQEQESEHLSSRVESMKKIESILNEVATIFTRLGTIVKMHEVLIERIDKNTEETLINVQKGKKNLLQVYDDVSGWRKTILTIFFIILAFSAIYILFLLQA